jgi:SAM-dependent methyltransferase
MMVVREGIEVIGIDISSTAVAQARSQFPQHSYVIADAARLPFGSSWRIETIICSEVIEHLQNPHQALVEFRRLMKVDGRLYLTTPNWISFYGLARAMARLLLGRDFTSGDQPRDRWSTRTSLGAQLRRAGFTPVQWLGLWFFPPFGKGDARIPDRFVVPTLRLLIPLERKLRRVLPSLAHILCVVSVKRS